MVYLTAGIPDGPTPVIATITRYEQSIYLYSKPLAADITIATLVECDVTGRVQCYSPYLGTLPFSVSAQVDQNIGDVDVRQFITFRLSRSDPCPTSLSLIAVTC